MYNVTNFCFTIHFKTAHLIVPNIFVKKNNLDIFKTLPVNFFRQIVVFINI